MRRTQLLVMSGRDLRFILRLISFFTFIFTSIMHIEMLNNIHIKTTK